MQITQFKMGKQWVLFFFLPELVQMNAVSSTPVQSVTCKKRTYAALRASVQPVQAKKNSSTVNKKKKGWLCKIISMCAESANKKQNKEKMKGGRAKD